MISGRATHSNPNPPARSRPEIPLLQEMNPPGTLPIGATLVEGWQLFLKSITVIILPVWIAGIADELPNLFAGGGLLTGSLGWPVLLITVLTWLVESALFASAIAKLDAFATSTALSYARALRIGMRAIPAVLIGDLLYNLAAWGGLVLFIVPGVILGTTLAFFAYAVVLDHKNIFDALGYSHALAWPHWWRTSVVISVPAIVLFVYDVIAGWADITSAIRQLANGQASSATALTNPWYDFGLMPLLGGVVWCYVLSVCYVQYRRLKERAGSY